jgi:hypothetical protein
LEKPREERSFREFFPDLHLNEPLRLVWHPPLASDKSSDKSASSIQLASQNHEQPASIGQTAIEGETDEQQSLLSSLSQIVTDMVDRIQATIHKNSPSQSEPLSAHPSKRPDDLEHVQLKLGSGKSSNTDLSSNRSNVSVISSLF